MPLKAGRVLVSQRQSNAIVDSRKGCANVPPLPRVSETPRPRRRFRARLRTKKKGRRDCRKCSSPRPPNCPTASAASSRMTASRSACSTGRASSTPTRISACTRAGRPAKASSCTRSRTCSAPDRTWHGQKFSDEVHFVCPWHGYEYDSANRRMRRRPAGCRLKSYRGRAARGGHLCRRRLRRLERIEPRSRRCWRARVQALCRARVAAQRRRRCRRFRTAPAMTATDAMVTDDRDPEGRERAGVRARHVAGVVGPLNENRAKPDSR